MFCKSCGKQIPDNVTFCPNCGASVTPVAPVAGMTPMASAAPMGGAPAWGAVPQRPVQHVSGAWYLVPLLFGIIGGIIAWAVNKDKDPKRARNLIIFGFVWSILGILIVVATFIYTATTLVHPYP